MDEKLKTILGEDLFAQLSEKLSAHPDVKLANVADGYVTQADYEQAKHDTEARVAASAAQLAEATAQLESGKKSWNDEKLALQKDYAIERALVQSKAKNITDFVGRLDRSQITLQDGKLLGFDEQIKDIRVDAPYLFADAGPAGAPPLNPVPPPATPTDFTGRVDAAVDSLLK